MMRVAVLVDEANRRLGKLTVGPACFVIRHADSTFVRTDKVVRLHHSHRALAVVFEQCEVYTRKQLEPI